MSDTGLYGLQRVRDNLAQTIQKQRSEYEQAKKHIDIRSSDIRELLVRIYQELGQYTAGDEPHKAVYLVATCYSWLSVIVRPYQIVTEFERKQQQLEAIDIEIGVNHG